MGGVANGDAGSCIGAIFQKVAGEIHFAAGCGEQVTLLPVLAVTPKVKLPEKVFTPLVFWPPSVNAPLVVSSIRKPLLIVMPPVRPVVAKW